MLSSKGEVVSDFLPCLARGRWVVENNSGLERNVIF